MQTMISCCSDRFWSDLPRALSARANQVATAGDRGGLDFADSYPLSELWLALDTRLERPHKTNQA